MFSNISIAATYDSRTVISAKPATSILSCRPFRAAVSLPCFQFQNHCMSDILELIRPRSYRLSVQAHVEQRMEGKPTDNGKKLKKLNCHNYICKIFTEKQQTTVKEKSIFTGKRRPTKPLVKRKRMRNRQFHRFRPRKKVLGE